MQGINMKQINRLLIIIAQALIVAVQAGSAYMAKALASEIQRF